MNADVVQIPCPKCGAELRLQDRSLLGRRGRCPNCGYRFVLREPEDVELELAHDPPNSESPVVGQAAQWVPDDAPLTLSPQLPPGVSPHTPQAGRAQPFPGGYEQHSAAAPVPSPIPPFDSTPEFAAAADPVATLIEENPAVKRVRRAGKRRKKRSKRGNLGIVVGSAAVVVIALVVTFGKFQNEDPVTVPVPSDNAPPALVANNAGSPPEVDPESIAVVDSPNPVEPPRELPMVDAPATDGEPLDLRFMPAGARVVIHMRCAELWSDDRQMAEFRACLGTELNAWLPERIQELCLFPPQEIESAQFALVLGSPGAPPETAASIRMARDVPRSEFIRVFQATRMDDKPLPYYISADGNRVYLLDDADPRHFVVGPRLYLDEMIDSQKFSAPTTAGITQLLNHTDRNRHLTVVFEPADLRIHQENLVAENVASFWNRLLEFFGDNAETAAWSLHLTREGMSSEFFLRNSTDTRPDLLQKEMEARVRQLPKRVLAAVEMMEPAAAGRRQLIGRFPAMMQAVALASRVDIVDRLVRLTTWLPGDRPAPNLALAALLTWDQSTVTDFSQKKPTPQATGPKLPDKIADRLRLPIDVEFNRMPLQQAFDYIAEETKINIIIDGDALKLAGYTRNMPQTFKLGKVPALNGIEAILKQYDQMVIVVDEKQQTLTVMTKAVAEAKMLTPYPVGPAAGVGS